jgi:hypothetical protein
MESSPAFTPRSMDFIRVDGVPRVTCLSSLHDGLNVSTTLHSFTYHEVIIFWTLFQGKSTNSTDIIYQEYVHVG